MYVKSEQHGWFCGDHGVNRSLGYQSRLKRSLRDYLSSRIHPVGKFRVANNLEIHTVHRLNGNRNSTIGSDTPCLDFASPLTINHTWLMGPDRRSASKGACMSHMIVHPQDEGGPRNGCALLTLQSFRQTQG